MKLTADYKWRRLRRWLNDVHSRAIRNSKNPQLAYHWRAEIARAGAFKATLLVMDAENRRAATKSRKRSER